MFLGSCFLSDVGLAATTAVVDRAGTAGAQAIGKGIRSMLGKQ